MARGALLVALAALAAALAAEAAPYGVKLCGRAFIRAVIFTCGGSRWRRAGGVGAPEAAGDDAFPDADAEADSLAGEREEALGPREWLSLTEPFQAVPGGRPGWQSWRGTLRGGRDVLAGLSSSCCKWGCSKREISSLC
ncbi:relaxin-3 [Ctenodactylus gundi]